MGDTMNIRVRGAEKKRFCINGNPDNVIEINTSDTGIIERLESAYNNLLELGEKAVTIKAGDIDINSEKSGEFFTQLAEIDKKLSETLDYIFDAKVAAACSGGGKMYDPVDGFFRFEAILDDLMTVLQEDLQAEFEKIAKKRAEHTAKYKKG